MSLQPGYLELVNGEIALHSDFAPPLVTEETIGPLPEPVQRFFRHCGYMGRELPYNALITYGSAELRMSEGNDFTPIRAQVFHDVLDLRRYAFMRSRIMGVLPLEAIGGYADGKEISKVRIMWVFGMGQVKSRDRHVSALASLLADAFLVPGLALQPYIRWIGIDKNTVRGQVRHEGMEVSGLFRFNEAGECVEYDTEDKFFRLKDDTIVRVRHTMNFDDYHGVNGVLFPARMRATWHLATGDFEYARAEFATVEHNLKAPIAGLLQGEPELNKVVA